MSLWLPGFAEGETLGRTDKTKPVEKQEKELVSWERRGARVASCHNGQASLPCWTADPECLQLLQKNFNFHGQVKCLG